MMMKLSLILFIQSQRILMLMFMLMMMIISINGLSVNLQNPPPSESSPSSSDLLLNNGNNNYYNEKHQSINSRQSIEIMKMNRPKSDINSGNNVKMEHITDSRISSTDDNNVHVNVRGIKNLPTILSSSALSSSSLSIINEEFPKTTEDFHRTSSSYTTPPTITTNSQPFTTITTKNYAADGSSDTIGAYISINPLSFITSTSSDATITTFTSNYHENKEEIFECGDSKNLNKGQFTGYDYAIVLIMLGISLGIGAFYGFCKKSGPDSSTEFLLGSEMSVFPVTLSLTTSFITAIELLGNPSEMFYQGTQFSLIVIPMVLVIPLAVKMFYPIYYKLNLTSCYEYLGIRFGRDLRIMGALLYIVQMSFYTAVAVLAPAIALSKATGLNTRIAIVLIYLVCIFYSSQGGMKAVVIADTFQAFVLAASLVLVVVLGTLYSGGTWKIFEKASEQDRIEFLNFDLNPTTRHTVFSVVIGGFFYWASLFCTNQASVQKCMSLKSLYKAKLALIFAIIGLIIVFLINFYTGLMVFTHYSQCDPLGSGQIGAADQLLPFYIMDVYKHIYTIAGIFVAGIFAASLGTVASALNSLAAVTCEDILINGFNIKLRPEKGAMYAKWMSLGYGVFSFILIFVVERLGGVLQATLTLNGLVGGVTFGLFILGIVFKRANAKGAFYGGIIALILVIYIGVMAQITNVDPKPLSRNIENCNCFVSNETFTRNAVVKELDDFMIIKDNINNNNKNSNNNNGIMNDDDKVKQNEKIINEIMMANKNMNINSTTIETINENLLMKIQDNNYNNSSSTFTSGNGSGSNNIIKDNNENNISNNSGQQNYYNHQHHHHQNHIEDRLRKQNDGDSDTLNDDNDQGFRFSSIYRISYMWYSMIGTLLTIIFGLSLSICFDAITKHKIIKITQKNHKNNDNDDNNHNHHHHHPNNRSTINNTKFFIDNVNDKKLKINSSPITSILNENLRMNYSSTSINNIAIATQTPATISTTSINNVSSGIDNFALRIDDEK